MNKDPWVLGISASPHNGAVCLLRGDEIFVAIQEERLTRIKRNAIYAAHPCMAIDYCLDYAGISAGDLDLVVCCVTNSAKVLTQDLARNPLLQVNANRTPVLYIPHHLGHAVSAFAVSGFSEAAVLVIDGLGSPYEDLTEDEKRACKWMVEEGGETISLYAASGRSVRALEKHMVEHSNWVKASRGAMREFGSLGGMYSAVADQIFGNLHEAGKVMGLAPYGEPDIPAGDFFSIEEGRFIFHDKVPKRFMHTDRWPLRQKEYENLAGSTQAALEEAVLYLVDHLYSLNPSENLCYAGGVALNSVANERIIRESAFKNVFIMPAAEDSGTAIGAAYYGLWRLTKRNGSRKLVHDAVGRNYSEAEITKALEETPAVERLSAEEIISETVTLLCQGKIVGWFQGRSELGPRALGQRSILCDPRLADGKEILNSRVKHRESFRPFAPVVIQEEAERWFDLEGANPESPFMLRICKFDQEKREQVPAVVHVDGTGRYQTLTREANGSLYDLVEKFQQETGVPIILNTSFNVAGEPIVETPEDALATLLSTGIDYCVLGRNIVGKRRRILFEENEVPWPLRIKEQLTRMARAAMRSESGQSQAHGRPSLEDFVGSFEDRVQGTLSISLDQHRLKGYFTAASALKKYIKWSAPLEYICEDIFEVGEGAFKGARLLYIRDRRRRVNAVAVAPGGDINRGAVFLLSPHTVSDSRERLEKLTGNYERNEKSMRVFLQRGAMRVAVAGQTSFELVPRSASDFMLKNLPGYAIEFKTSVSGMTTEATVTQPNGVFTLEKTE
jgi:carbamoyltransferase